MLAGCDEAWEPPPCGDPEPGRDLDLTVCSEVLGTLNLEFVRFERPRAATCATLRADPGAWRSLSAQRRLPLQVWQRAWTAIPLSRPESACEVGMFLAGPAPAVLVVVDPTGPEVHATVTETEPGRFSWIYPFDQTGFLSLD